MLRTSKRPVRSATVIGQQGSTWRPHFAVITGAQQIRGDTMNIRRSWITALAAAPMLALPLLSAGAAPAAAAVPGSGHVTCPIKDGTGMLSPGLTSTGNGAGTVKIIFNGTLATHRCTSAVTQPPGDQVTGGTFTGNGWYNGAQASSCANFDGVDVVGQVTVIINWRTTGMPIAPTKIVYNNNPKTVSGSPFDTIALNAPPGTAVKSGSFSSAPTPHLTQLKTNLVGPSCPVGPPLATFVIVGGQVKV
jgi:hypothetical protein